MYRCAPPASPRRRSLTAMAASTALLSVAAVLAGVASIATPTAAQAQIVPGHRYFPQRALRGELVIGVMPDAKLNGKPVRLAPGARIRNAVDLVATPGSLYDQKLTVLYTTDISGLLLDIWVLNEVELANKSWPSTPEQASKLVFDQASQVWRKP
ncbi:hypothetical protein [Mitsuaria sp. GD03876]|uniref:hypothetical protein n=1 Tax=Mitsuaria sp. GD03876 TaxID=2975399 RepID=UPI002448A9A2|nr:hypothetical protein [Mitsuaria sp. GD03876]MDH0867639.1 hypothetical protein [Mitsuaria sp. GD03876]